MIKDEIFNMDCLAGLRTLPDRSANCCVTSPPYYGLRDYGVPGQLGLERTPAEYVGKLVEIFQEVRRVLRDDGTLWLNLGDCYNAYNANRGTKSRYAGPRSKYEYSFPAGYGLAAKSLKQKDLMGIPWRVAFALQADGWYLRSDIIWHKPNAMPESVRNRPTKAHEYLFLLTKSKRYFYDHEAIKEPCVYGDHPRNGIPGTVVRAPRQNVQHGISKLRSSGNKARVYGMDRGRPGSHLGASIPWNEENGMRNKRSVWTVSTKPCKEAHFATFPPALIRPCILAGCQGGGIVLDPFMGAGTTALVAKQEGRSYIGFELNPEYIKIAEKRIMEVK